MTRPVLGFQVSADESMSDESRSDRSHSHAKAQLLYTLSGLVEIVSGTGNLVIPPGAEKTPKPMERTHAMLVRLRLDPTFRVCPAWPVSDCISVYR
jgi:hypothetical protein